MDTRQAAYQAGYKAGLAAAKLEFSDLDNVVGKLREANGNVRNILGALNLEAKQWMQDTTSPEGEFAQNLHESIDNVWKQLNSVDNVCDDVSDVADLLNAWTRKFGDFTFNSNPLSKQPEGA